MIIVDLSKFRGTPTGGRIYMISERR